MKYGGQHQRRRRDRRERQQRMILPGATLDFPQLPSGRLLASFDILEESPATIVKLARHNDPGRASC